MPQAIVDSKTGISAIDDAINQLYETGYMHNHFRMYTAAICCNIAKYEFQTSGKWLYYNLLDADIGSNFASWQWVSGHLTNRKYIANQDNIDRYSREKQEGTFLDKTYPELEKMDVPKVLEKSVSQKLKTALPKNKLPKLEGTVLLYTFYNLDPKWHSHKKCSRVLILKPSHFENYPISDKVLDFMLELTKNISDLIVFSGEFSDLKKANPDAEFISKEHPILIFEGAAVDERDWIIPEVSGYFQSFSKYYMKCLDFMLEKTK